MTKANSKMTALAWAAAILLAGVAPIFAQGPGQGPGQALGNGMGQGTGQNPSVTPIHIPHIGGSRQEKPQPETSTEGRVYVLLWFDTEDYILPQSDDAA
ncbi:MAG: hypothetical protein P4N24_13000, partial [Acidobacteriota bacterium]|nr:hypothetical protein [Acidobacteriota bacterium]